jgi:hypothetical protein
MPRFGDIDHDGTIELIVGDNGGNIQAFNSSTTTAEWTSSAFGLGVAGNYHGVGLLIAGERDQHGFGVGAPTINLGEVEKAPPQSRIDNTGTRNMTAYVNMSVFNLTGSVIETIVENWELNLTVGNYTKLDVIWSTAGGFDTASYADGNYTANAKITDSSGNILQNYNDSSYMNSSWTFEIDNTAPTLSYDVPGNKSTVADPTLSDDNNYRYAWSINTSELAICKFSTNANEAWKNMSWISQEYAATHYHKLELIDETIYYFYII